VTVSPLTLPFPPSPPTEVFPPPKPVAFFVHSLERCVLIPPSPLRIIPFSLSIPYVIERINRRQIPDRSFIPPPAAHIFPDSLLLMTGHELTTGFFDYKLLMTFLSVTLDPILLVHPQKLDFLNLYIFFLPLFVFEFLPYPFFGPPRL